MLGRGYSPMSAFPPKEQTAYAPKPAPLTQPTEDLPQWAGIAATAIIVIAIGYLGYKFYKG